MTEKRQEQRRNQDAIDFAKYTLDRKNYIATIEAQERLIKHLQSCVVTDNSKTLAAALERISALESLLAMAGAELSYSHDIHPSTKELIAEIDAILPATEGDKE